MVMNSMIGAIFFLLSWNFKFIQLNDYKKYVLDQRALLRIEKQILDLHTLYQIMNYWQQKINILTNWK